mmetsp:Transcript_34637/g.111201  ORF Transcript_34637/g.111201 Transcript_34637/m.111201 type:complete len:230 (+) Transcript_34637:470-1159(+)
MMCPSVDSVSTASSLRMSDHCHSLRAPSLKVRSQMFFMKLSPVTPKGSRRPSRFSKLTGSRPHPASVANEAHGATLSRSSDKYTGSSSILSRSPPPWANSALRELRITGAMDSSSLLSSAAKSGGGFTRSAVAASRSASRNPRSSKASPRPFPGNTSSRPTSMNTRDGALEPRSGGGNTIASAFKFSSSKKRSRTCDRRGCRSDDADGRPPASNTNDVVTITPKELSTK